jgi:hypothetical protein
MLLAKTPECDLIIIQDEDISFRREPEWRRPDGRLFDIVNGF